jgi:NADH-quinone oxidoreductase subunit L
MTVPLVLLAIPAALLGLALGLPFGHGLISQWLAPVFEAAHRNLGLAEAPVQIFGLDGVLLLVSVAVAAAGLAVAIKLFGFHWPLRGSDTDGDPARVTALTARAPFLYRASHAKWWFDELNDLLFVRIGGFLANAVWWFDRVIVDGTVNGIGDVMQGAGRDLRRVQTGHVQNYALGIAIALIVMSAGFLLVAARG